jgi:toxin ParE1/3/4
MARLTITVLARADLTEIRDYIARDNPTAARRLIERLRDKARAVAESPGIGRSRESDLRLNLFSFPVGQYLLFYQPQRGGGIVLVRVLHGSRDLPALF